MPPVQNLGSFQKRIQLIYIYMKNATFTSATQYTHNPSHDVVVQESNFYIYKKSES
jgi:hypothetical protein